jgi:hypothetical protein
LGGVSDIQTKIDAGANKKQSVPVQAPDVKRSLPSLSEKDNKTVPAANSKSPKAVPAVKNSAPVIPEKANAAPQKR